MLDQVTGIRTATWRLHRGADDACVISARCLDMSQAAHIGARLFGSMAYRHGRGMALVYHQILPPGGRRPHTSTQLTAADFEAQIAFIAATCRVMEIDAFVAALQTGRLPARACLITFDDGFVDNHDIALPVLQRHRIPAVFFIASGYVTSGRAYEADAVHDLLRLAPARAQVQLDLRSWHGPAMNLPYANGTDRRASYFQVIRIFKDQIRAADRPAVVAYLAERFGVAADDLTTPAMMTPKHVRQLSDAGMTVGSHTEWHVSLSAEGPDEYARQLRTSRQTLEDITGRPVRYFSYPFGDPQYCIPAAPLVREARYEAAFMACGLACHTKHGPWLIDRLATSGGLTGLVASMLGIKPSQFRQRRARARYLRQTPEAGWP
jgi:peptidoglycan/xylan/chitin deacetylase (PgdA/CDA1 family)